MVYQRQQMYIDMKSLSLAIDVEHAVIDKQNKLICWSLLCVC